jgi:hypothetical protein
MRANSSRNVFSTVFGGLYSTEHSAYSGRDNLSFTVSSHQATAAIFLLIFHNRREAAQK